MSGLRTGRGWIWSLPALRRRRGMSMIEVLIALTLLSVGALATLGMFPSMAQLNRHSIDNTAGLYFAEQKMDQLLACNQYPGNGSDTPSGLNGTRTWTSSTDPYGNSTMLTVAVQVTWVEHGHLGTITLYGQMNQHS